MIVLFLTLNCRTRVGTTPLVRELLFTSKNIDDIKFGDFLRHFAIRIGQSFGILQKIVMRFKVNDVPVEFDLVLPCWLIINELLTNSFKHGFPQVARDPDLMTLPLLFFLNPEKGNEYTLIVRDNSIGTQPGFDWNNTSSLGLKLVKARAVHQLRGTFTMKNSGGTKVVLPLGIRNHQWRALIGTHRDIIVIFSGISAIYDLHGSMMNYSLK